MNYEICEIHADGRDVLHEKIKEMSKEGWKEFGYIIIRPDNFCLIMKMKRDKKKIQLEFDYENL
jgi:hypothetical protein